MASGGTAERIHQHRLGQLRHLADGLEPGVVQPRRGHRADSPQPLHRQRVKKLELAVGRHHQQAVGLGHRAGDLRKELRARDAHADRQPHLLPDARRSRLAISTGVPAKCSMPRTSRKASSIESASTTGAVSSKILKTALLASE